MSSNRPLVSHAGASKLESRVMNACLVGEEGKEDSFVLGVLKTMGGRSTFGVLRTRLGILEGVCGSFVQAFCSDAIGNTPPVGASTLASKVRPLKAVLNENDRSLSACMYCVDVLLL